MGAKRETELPLDMKKVQEKLEEWRRQRRHGQRIPEEVWGAAIQAACRHGLNRVSRALGLDYYYLKKRFEQGRKKGLYADIREAVFVELENAAPEESESNPACVVELEKGNGVRMRISVRDAATVDWSRMKEAFLGA